MAVQPIDLQILFSQMNQVGKEQAAIRGQEVAQQVSSGDEIVKKTSRSDHSVNESKDVGEGPHRTDNEREPSGREEKGHEEKKSKGQTEKDKIVFSDPALGANIDLTG